MSLFPCFWVFMVTNKRIIVTPSDLPCMQQYYIPSARELAWLALVCRAPIVQHFGESISGAATIRSFDQESRFMERILELTDIYTRPCLHNVGVNEWLGIRIDFLSNLVFAFALVVLVSLPEGVLRPNRYRRTILACNYSFLS